jgi:O-antigen/teichoic acid export membrane protein
MALKHQVFLGSVWSLAGTAGQQVVNFILFVMLARLLSPADFGVMAIAAIVIDILALIGCLGQVQALVQRADLDDTIASTSFWMVQGFGLAMTALVFFTAPLMAELFAVPALSPVLQLLSPVCMLQSLSAVHEAWLRRSFGFKWLAARMVVASIFGGIVSVGLALQGFGIYAMVGQRLIIAFVLVLMVWWSSAWRPKLRWVTAEAIALARVGGDISLVAFLQVANVRVVDVVVGYLFGPQILGQLRIAWKLFDFVIAIAVQPIVNVSLPALSRLQSNHKAMANATVRLISVSATALYPIFFGIAVIAPDVVPPLFGDKWDEAIRFIQILSPIAIAATINYFLMTTLTAAGRTRWILWQALGQVVLALSITAATAPFGVVPVLVGNVVRASIIALVNVWLLKLAIGAAPSSIARGLLPPLVAATCMAAVLVAARPLFLDLSDISLVRAIATAFVGSMLFGLVLWFAFPSWRRNMQMELKPLLLGKGSSPL